VSKGPYATLGRGELVYLKKADERREVKIERDMIELNEMQKGEDGIDYTSTPMSWMREQNAAWDYSMSRLE
jgi:hypothetical protein